MQVCFYAVKIVTGGQTLKITLQQCLHENLLIRRLFFKIGLLMMCCKILIFFSFQNIDCCACEKV